MEIYNIDGSNMGFDFYFLSLQLEILHLIQF